MKYKTDSIKTQIQWLENDVPFSSRYQDIYFTPEQGLDEAKHVFITGNQLIRRWDKLTSNQSFTIFECGFGTGLNCLATLEEWLRVAPRGKLRYVAFEGYPLTPAEIGRALSIYAPVTQHLSHLIENYAQLLSQGKITLGRDISVELIICEAENLANSNRLPDSIDAIYLDGFSPSKNQEMWSSELAQLLYQKCHQDSTLATFSVAGQVRRNLTGAGFFVRKIEGYGKKREMLVGHTACSW